MQLTDIIVPFDSQLGVMGRTGSDDVETELIARLQLSQSVAQRARRHLRHRRPAIAAHTQLTTKHKHFYHSFIHSNSLKFITFIQFKKKYCNLIN